MNALAHLHARYPNLMRMGWFALLIILAACNNNSGGGSSGGGGGIPGY